jgi:hypothetical protein
MPGGMPNTRAPWAASHRPHAAGNMLGPLVPGISFCREPPGRGGDPV